MLTSDKFRLEIKLTALDEDGGDNEIRHDISEELELTPLRGGYKIQKEVPRLCAGNPIMIIGWGGSQMSAILDWFVNLNRSPHYRPFWMECDDFARAGEARDARQAKGELLELAPVAENGKAPADWRHTLRDMGLSGHLSTAFYNAVHNFLYGPDHQRPPVTVTDFVQLLDLLGGREFLLEGKRMQISCVNETNSLCSRLAK